MTATVLALSFAAAGCGGSDAPEAESTPAAQREPSELFVSSCGSCHTLAAAGTSGRTGPNLDELAPDAQTVRSAIASGPGAMPENLLEGEDAQRVADYVAESAGQ